MMLGIDSSDRGRNDDQRRDAPFLSLRFGALIIVAPIEGTGDYPASLPHIVQPVRCRRARRARSISGSSSTR
jgi:hypothetical protein